MNTALTKLNARVLSGAIRDKVIQVLRETAAWPEPRITGGAREAITLEWTDNTWERHLTLVLYHQDYWDRFRFYVPGRPDLEVDESYRGELLGKYLKKVFK